LRIKEANCRALVLNFYSHIPISKKKKCKEAKYMVIKMMCSKRHISITDVISEKQIKFSSNLQDEAVKKCQIQSIQVEEIVQITELHR
jgi:hypothetical protein